MDECVDAAMRKALERQGGIDKTGELQVKYYIALAHGASQLELKRISG